MGETAGLARGGVFALLEHAKFLYVLPAERGDTSAIGTTCQWGLVGVGVGWDGLAAVPGWLHGDSRESGPGL